MKRHTVIYLVLAFLVGVAGFSVYRFIITQKENNTLSTRVEDLNTEVSSLEGQNRALMTDLDSERELKQALEEENSQVKNNLRLTQEQLTQLAGQFHEAQQLIEDLTAQVSSVKEENSALRDQVQSLQLDVSQAKADNEALKTRMNSIDELKKAIKELRQKIRLAKQTVAGHLIQQRMIIGNAGFLIRDGKPTASPAKVKIKVEPLP